MRQFLQTCAAVYIGCLIDSYVHPDRVMLWALFATVMVMWIVGDLVWGKAAPASAKDGE